MWKRFVKSGDKGRINRPAALLLAVLMIGGVLMWNSAYPFSRSYAEEQRPDRASGTFFTDVAASDWFSEDVEAVSEAGLFTGYKDGSFRPDEKITIAQTIAAAARIHSRFSGDTGIDFNSLPGSVKKKSEVSSEGEKTVWYKPYVDYAEANGIIGKDEYGNVDRPAARRSVACILAKALPESQYKEINRIREGAVYDLDPEAFYAGPVYRLYRAGILTGRDKYGRFDAEYPVTRAEAAAFINRLADKDRRVRFRLEAPDEETAAVYEILRSMSTKKKVSQLFLLTPEALTGTGTPVTDFGEEMESMLEKYPVGGLIFFSDNLKNPEQTKKLLSDLDACAGETQHMPLFLCVDEEGGRVARISGNSSFGLENPGPMESVRTFQDAYDTGRYIGSYLKDLGFNMDLAPVVDVMTVSTRTDLSDRSFGTDPKRVTMMAANVARGLHGSGIFCTYKHFPGNGSTEADTHEGIAYTDDDLQTLRKRELIPYVPANAIGVDAVMISHVSVPAVTGDDTPASLSKRIVTGILRKEMGYRGLVMTDSLSMGAITQNFTTEEYAVQAVRAGADLLLMPDDFPAARQAVLDAVERGEISMERLDASVKRIIKKKLEMKG